MHSMMALEHEEPEHEEPLQQRVHERRLDRQRMALGQSGAPSGTMLAEELLQNSALNNTLLIVLSPEAKNLPTLDAAYRHHFWDILYVAPKATNKEIHDFHARGFAVAPCAKYRQHAY